MSLEATLLQSEKWMDGCVARVNTLSVPTINRARVAAALHQLSIEHYTGIHVLVGTGVYSAAFALYRPQLEAYVRGAWYHRCATDLQVSGLISGDESPSLKVQMLDLERNGAFDPGSLIHLKTMTWKQLCDFTHGGSLQIKVRAATIGEIRQDFRPAHVAALLVASATTALLAGVGLAAVAENEAMALELRDAYRAVFE
jgi:hypothetical protein